MVFIEMIGKTFGKLTVIAEAPSREYVYPNGMVRNIKYSLCQCGCGIIIKVQNVCLRSGNTKSCGCIQKELARKRHTTHGLTGTKLFWVWEGMKQRCDNKNNSNYKNYGGRGVSYDSSWKKFENFYNDMSDTYVEGLSLDRIDNNGNYNKQNCRWATIQQQANNRRTNHYIIYNDIEYTLIQLANKFNMEATTLWARLYRQKLSLEEALTKKVRFRTKKIKN